MTHLHKLRTSSILKWVSSNFDEHHLRLLATPSQPTGSLPNVHIHRFYRTTRTPKNGGLTRAVKHEAQAALLDYLYSNRGLNFADAESMSKNSPHFINKLLKCVDSGEEVGPSISRYLLYNPVNEFELFFESLGLEPSEYVSFLPDNLMFLTDESLLLHNYAVLCQYGVERNMIGRIYKEATEVFRCDPEVLQSKLGTLEEELGLSRLALVKFIIASPCILVGDVNVAFVKVLEKFKSLGFDASWVQGNLTESESHSWGQMLEVLSFFSGIGFSNKQLEELLGQHPDIVFEASGATTFSLIGILLKLRCTMSQIGSVFLQFPHIGITKFASNMRRCFVILNEINLEVTEIGKIVHSHPLLLGSIALKSTNTLLLFLRIGKRDLARYIQENPQEMKNWVLGRTLRSLELGNVRSKTYKFKVLLDLGLVENGSNINEAVNQFEGNGWELKERFDCIVEAGLERNEVCKMIKSYPPVLYQSKKLIEMKIDLLVNHLCYPISSLLVFPRYFKCGIEKIKQRIFMLNWLKEQGTVDPGHDLSLIFSYSDLSFLKRFVNHHSSGPQVWQKLKNEINLQ